MSVIGDDSGVPLNLHIAAESVPAKACGPYSGIRWLTRGAFFCRPSSHVITCSGISRTKKIQECTPEGPHDVLLRIHGDEGPFFKKRNLLVLSLSFPHNHGATHRR